MIFHNVALLKKNGQNSVVIYKNLLEIQVELQEKMVLDSVY